MANVLHLVRVKVLLTRNKLDARNCSYSVHVQYCVQILINQNNFYLFTFVSGADFHMVQFFPSGLLEITT